MNNWKGLAVMLLGLGVLLSGCQQEKPESLYNPNYLYNPNPVITAMEPADSALAGIVTIKIIGENFSPIKENNFVHFGKTKAVVLDASANQLVVQSPNFIADSTAVRVSVLGAISFSNSMPYRLVRGVGEFGGFGDYDEPYMVECDKDENLYVALGSRKIVKITPAEVKTDYATTTFSLFTGLAFGPDGMLYVARNTRYLYRVPAGGGSAAQWVRVKDAVYALDFAPGGFLFVGGKGDSLYKVTIQGDGASKGIMPYPDTYIKAIRVFNGYVYIGGKVNATNQQAIWRNQILSENELGPTELYFDWSTKISTTFEILAITFAADGDMYVGTDAPEAVIVIHPDGTFAPLYPGVLEPTSYSLSWGNKQFLYIARRSDDAKKRRVIKINMLKEGAPYYGRP